MSVVFPQSLTHSQLISQLQSNYHSLKNLTFPISCKLSKKCGITNTQKLSEVMKTFCTKLSSSKLVISNENDRKKEHQSIYPTIPNEKSDRLNGVRTLLVSSVNSNLENLSDDALSNLFANELQNTKSDKKLIRETLSHLSVGYNETAKLAKLSSRSHSQRRHIRERYQESDISCHGFGYSISAMTSDDFLENENATGIPEQSYKGTSDTKSTDLRYHFYAQNTEEARSKSGNESLNDGRRSKIVNRSTIEQNLIDRPHRCVKCKMAFKRKLHLKRHFVVTHTENKNFRCGTCGKQFSRKDYLDKHITGHQKRNFKLKLLQQGIVVRTKMHLKTDTNV